jgi:hypothetical protein
MPFGRKAGRLSEAACPRTNPQANQYNEEKSKQTLKNAIWKEGRQAYCDPRSCLPRSRPASPTCSDTPWHLLKNPPKFVSSTKKSTTSKYMKDDPSTKIPEKP